MYKVIRNIYFKLKSNEINKAKIKLKRQDINIFYESITKMCWKNNINYKVIFKDKSNAIILMKGKKENLLLKYDKADIVFFHEYEKFLNSMYSNAADRGIYISCGVFEEEIRDYCRNPLNDNKVTLVDQIDFLSYQLGIKGKWNTILEENNIKLYKYLPK